MQRKLIPCALGLAVLALAGCGGDGTLEAAQPSGAGAGGDMASVDTASAAPSPPGTGGAPAIDVANLPPGVTPQMVQEGQQIFTGVGICQTCHGPNAQGTTLAPNLTDDEWINVDGSYDAIVQVVNTGVQQPKQHPAPMPAKGGANLTEQQVRAVAAYVYSISHRGG